MPTQLVITDVTRMGGTRVCVAGVSRKNKNIRPIFRVGGIEETWLYDGDQIIIRPFAQVSFKPVKHRPQPPHTEDCIVQDNFKMLNGILDEDQKFEFLQSILDQDVQSIFGAKLHYKHGQGYFVRDGEGVRSLGTIHVRVTGFSHKYYEESDSWDYRLYFGDSSGESYGLKATDLSFLYYVDDLRNNKGIDPATISNRLNRFLHDCEVYLRIGLARSTWAAHPNCCHLQITGVYTFPDYLNGRCFADFRRP